MSGGPLNVFFLILICAPITFTLRCKPPQQHQETAINEEDQSKKPELDKYTEAPMKVIVLHKRKQKSFIRNPNYISANKKFDDLVKGMYMLELPKPHPGALAGSTRGCNI